MFVTETTESTAARETRGVRGGIGAGNKIDNRALEVSASIALEGITRD